METNFNLYLESIASENTMKATRAVTNILESYMESAKIHNIEEMTEVEVDAFLKRACDGKSNTTISNILSKLRGVFAYYNNTEAVKHISLNHVRSMVNTRRQEYIIPSDIYKLIEGLINYQDKALVLLIYLGLYDNEFNTIKNIKAENVKDGYIILPNGTEFKLNAYSNNIIQMALKEEEMEKYSKEATSKHYPVNTESQYLIRSKKRNNCDEVIPAITLKKRFETYSKYTGIHCTPVKIKNSRIIYDLVKYEYNTNCGMNVNQIELGHMLKLYGVKGTIEQLNMSKKIIKQSILQDIIQGKDFFVQ